MDDHDPLPTSAEPALSRRELVATYRLQLTSRFTLDDAIDIVPYLAELGISHVYVSPPLRARTGSTHGYDVVDHREVDEQLGGAAAFERFHDTLAQLGLGLVVDVVPNHMAIDDARNALWWDVLEHGRESRRAHYFDIDWDAPTMRGRVMVPVLGEAYGDELKRGAISLVADDGEVRVAYYDHRFPTAGGSTPDPADLEAVNRDADRLDEILERQHYRLTSWRMARHELNYRRFFDVNTLAALRVEDDDVFDEVHGTVLDWVRRGVVDGLRIDHVDGLAAPLEYLLRLREQAPDAWITVEKILAAGEHLPPEWPVQGTTGYDAMRLLSGLHVDTDTAEEVSQLYTDLIGGDSFEVIERDSKWLIVREMLAADVSRLCNVAVPLFEADFAMRDTSRRDQRTAIEALLVAMPVYRTYADRSGATDVDRNVLDRARRHAQCDPMIAGVDPRVIDFVITILSVQADFGDPCAEQFVRRFQQLSSAVMAKGVEDAAMYRWSRLIALNEVGGDPMRFGVTAGEYVDDLVVAGQTSPLSMVATSTHDTKRSEDVRLRIALLSQDTTTWADASRRWHARHSALWSHEPDPAIAHLIYQTMVGAHPLPRDRAEQYVLKAVREAKVRTSWLWPNESYEADVVEFLDRLYADDEFLDDLATVAQQFVVPARAASLVQVGLKVLRPGVPDIYQGAELWTDDLVDPDNRRPVDFATRRAILASSARDAPPNWRTDEQGVAKLWLLRRALEIRRELIGMLAQPVHVERIAVTGGAVNGIVAYSVGDALVVVASIRTVDWCRRGWRDCTVELPAGNFEEQLSGRRVGGLVALADAAGDWPIAVFVREDAS